MLITESRQVFTGVVLVLIALLIPPLAYGQWAIDFSSDGSLIATCGSHVRVYEVKTGKLLHDIEGKSTKSIAFNAIAFSPATPNQFVCGGEDGVLRLWQVGKKDFVREFRGHDGVMWSAAFERSGRYVASGSVRYQEGKAALGQFRLWETETGKVVQSLDVKDGGIHGVSFSGDGKLVAFCRNMNTEASSVEVYHVQPWKLASSVKLSAGANLETTKWGKAVPFGFGTRFEPDQKRLLVAGGICVRVDPAPYEYACQPTGLLWRADLGEASAILLDEPKREYYRSLGITPDGKRFATGNGNNAILGGKARVQMRDVETGKLLWSVASDAEPYAVTTSPDGEIVAVGQRDGVLLLNARTGETIRSISAKR
jgi:WD40 repeat protein